MVEYLSGNRIQGSTYTQNVAAKNTSWKQVGRSVVGSGGATSLSCTFTPKDRHMVLFFREGVSGGTGGNGKWQVGSSGSIDAGSNYAERYSHYGNDDTAQNGQTGFGQWDTGTHERFDVLEFTNKSGEETTIYGHCAVNNDSGTSSDPFRVEFVGKWTGTGQVNIIKWQNTNTMVEGSEMIVLGMDNDDDGSTGTNFWQELKNFNKDDGNGSQIICPTFTAKKYLMVDAFTIPANNGFKGRVEFGTSGSYDTSNVYRQRWNDNGTDGDSTDGTPNASHYAYTNDVSISQRINMIIVNKSDKIKLTLYWANSSGGASDDGFRREGVGKYVRTDRQITDIRLHNQQSGGDAANNSYIRVCGGEHSA